MGVRLILPPGRYRAATRSFRDQFPVEIRLWHYPDPFRVAILSSPGRFLAEIPFCPGQFRAATRSGAKYSFHPTASSDETGGGYVWSPVGVGE